MYKVIGSDQQVYGPVSAAQLQQWMAEGRVNLATLVQLEGSADWKPLSSVPQFAAPPPVSMPRPPARAQSDGLALGGLICGILSIVCCCASPIFGILGLVFSIIVLGRHQDYPAESSRQTALAGLILSIIGLIWHSLLPFFLIVPGGLTFRHFRRW
jgi:GYF domain 2